MPLVSLIKEMFNGNYNQSLQGLLLTVILGIYFTALQAYEYLHFQLKDLILKFFLIFFGIGICFLLMI